MAGLWMLAHSQSQFRGSSVTLIGISKLHNSLTSSWIPPGFLLASVIPWHVCNVAQRPLLSSCARLRCEPGLIGMASLGSLPPCSLAACPRHSLHQTQGVPPPHVLPSTPAECTSPRSSVSFRQDQTQPPCPHVLLDSRGHIEAPQEPPQASLLRVPVWAGVSTTPCVRLTSCRLPHLHEQFPWSPLHLVWGHPFTPYRKGRISKTSKSPYDYLSESLFCIFNKWSKKSHMMLYLSSLSIDVPLLCPLDML